MARKRREYFQAGTRLVWEVDPVSRTVTVFHSPDEFTLLGATETLEGGAVLPGFALPLGDLFADLDRHVDHGGAKGKVAENQDEAVGWRMAPCFAP